MRRTRGWSLAPAATGRRRRVRADLAGLARASLGGGEASQQAEYAHDPAISGNGRYVAFDGSVRRRHGRVAARPRRPARSNRSPAATPSCPRSAKTGSTSASPRTKARASAKSPTGGCATTPKQEAAERVRARHVRGARRSGAHSRSSPRSNGSVRTPDLRGPDPRRRARPRSGARRSTPRATRSRS